MEPLSRNELRTLRGLTSRPVRRRRGLFLLEGVRALRTALENGADVRLVVIADDVEESRPLTAIMELAERRRVAVR